MKTHMIGIGGAGMSGIAEVLKSRGDEVTGSDLKESPYTRRLRAAGITVFIGHAGKQVGGADRVVVSTAIPKTNPEFLEARRRDIPVIPRAAALASILEGSCSVAVAGTHGKTTTTSMTAHVLRALGENPTALVGGELNDIGSNVAFGRPDLVVAEADESDRSLLYLHPRVAVVTNVEFDHPDFYTSLDEVVETFSKFVGSLPADGHLVACADDPRCAALTTDAPCPVTTYGLTAGDLTAEILGPNSYTLLEGGERRGPGVEVERGARASRHGTRDRRLRFYSAGGAQDRPWRPFGDGPLRRRGTHHHAHRAGGIQHGRCHGSPPARGDNVAVRKLRRFEPPGMLRRRGHPLPNIGGQ